WRVALGMFTNPDDRRFVIGVLVAFLPAVVVGLAVGKSIKELLFNPWVVCFTLIVGGAILLVCAQLFVEPHVVYAPRSSDLRCVTRHGFAFFAWWRVVIGTLGLIALALGR